MNNIFFEPKGRLGNALFRYFAIIILLYENKNFKYGGISKKSPLKIIDDNNFLLGVKNNNLQLPEKYNYLLNGFYQLQEILKYKIIIKQYFENHPEHIIYNYPYEEIKINNLIKPLEKPRIYDIILHLRLEDFIENNEYIHYKFILNLLDKVTPSFFSELTVAIVLNQPKSSFELEYLANIKNWFFKNNINIVIESNDIITDFHLMKNTKKLICSNSTICWCAAFLSDNLTTCYMPDYKIRNDRSHQTFKYPIKNTILYSIYD